MKNLIELIQKNLGYPELHKIDPNTQDIHTDEKHFGLHTVAQAAIPAVVCGLCFRLTTAEGVEQLSLETMGQGMDFIFGKQKNKLIDRICEYSGATQNVVSQECDHIANEGVRLMQEYIPGNSHPAPTSLFLTEEKAHALLYLPAVLQVGELLNDDQLDDRTHKMNGPISGLMHSVEKQF